MSRPSICENASYRDSDRTLREGDYAFAKTRAKPFASRKHHLERGYAVASRFAKSISAKKREKERSNLFRSFREHVTVWNDETGHLSSVTKAITYPSYQRIIGMGRDVLPQLLAELKATPDHWLVALHAITGKTLCRTGTLLPKRCPPG